MHAIWIIFIAATGACVGSFLNVVIWRLPRNESIAFPPSHCPACGRAIRWYHNIPLLSWVMLKGRCRDCGVAISPRYLLIEAVTAAMLVGLYLCYYVWPVRAGIGPFTITWPMYLAHATLLCGLLACTMIDIDIWQVPLELCWFVTGAGILIATIWPPGATLLPGVSQATAAACTGATLGLVIALILLRYRVILPSFLDAEYRPAPAGQQVTVDGEQPNAPAVAITELCGVNPRIEVLRELLFLLPVIAGAIGAALLVKHVSAVGEAWRGLWALAGGQAGIHLDGFFAAVFGYYIGAGMIWATRILGTLGFGKEAMGLGDVHILASAGAVAGWAVPVMAFFLAPIFGLLWALFLLARRGQKELPYGPWLSLGTAAALIGYDTILQYIDRYLALFR
jgi:leader peptidase (prepilin peptidase) / N-methyltransferase